VTNRSASVVVEETKSRAAAGPVISVSATEAVRAYTARLVEQAYYPPKAGLAEAS
jgi:hypothetical protein